VGALLLLLLGAAFIRYRRRKNMPHNFNSMLELVDGLSAGEMDR